MFEDTVESFSDGEETDGSPRDFDSSVEGERLFSLECSNAASPTCFWLSRDLLCFLATAFNPDIERLGFALLGLELPVGVSATRSASSSSYSPDEDSLSNSGFLCCANFNDEPDLVVEGGSGQLQSLEPFLHPVRECWSVHAMNTATTIAHSRKQGASRHTNKSAVSKTSKEWEQRFRNLPLLSSAGRCNNHFEFVDVSHVRYRVDGDGEVWEGA